MNNDIDRNLMIVDTILTPQKFNYKHEINNIKTLMLLYLWQCARKPQYEVAFKWGWPTVVEIQGSNKPRLHAAMIVIYMRLTINVLFNTTLNTKKYVNQMNYLN